MDELTIVQAEILSAVRQRVGRGKPPPSYRELCSEFGWRSTGTARDHLKALERKGYVQLPGHRGGRVTLRDGPAATGVSPIVGRIVAGVPVEAEEEVEGHLTYPIEWSGGAPCFALQVYGDSMVNAGVLEGDHVVVRPQKTARSGEIVAATVDGETTLKRLVKEGSRRLLVSENPRYKPISLNSESAMIHGVVVGLLRAYHSPRSAARATKQASNHCGTGD